MNEIWKDIIGFEGLYQVSDTGKIKSMARTILRKNGVNLTINEKVIAPYKCNGYNRIVLRKDNRSYKLYVHRLVASVFIPNPQNYEEVNHIDSCRSNNAISNLEWVTPRMNVTHMVLKTKKSIGVKKSRKRWSATIYINGKHRHLGTFDTEMDASMMYHKTLNQII